MCVINFNNNHLKAENCSSKENIESIALLAKSWGILKYYHPNVISLKEKNLTDSLLFKSINALDNNKDVNQIVTELINNFGVLRVKKEIISEPILKDTLFRLLNNHNKQALSLVVNSYKGFKNPYYYNKDGDYQPFKNEESYKDFGTYPPKELRLLSLFRLYHVLYYFYPYPNQIDTDLDDLLLKYIPLVISAKDDIEFHKNIFGFMSHVKDSHTLIFSKAFYDKWHWDGFYPPIHIDRIDDKFIISKILNDSLTTQDILSVGDNILSIDGKPIEEVYEFYNQLYGNSNDIAQYFKLCRYNITNGAENSEIKFNITHNGVIKGVTLNRNISFGQDYLPPVDNVNYRILNDTALYINATKFSKEFFNDNIFRKHFYTSKILIIDMRGYILSGDVFRSLLGRLTNKKILAANFEWVSKTNITKMDSSNFSIKPLFFRKKHLDRKIYGLINIHAISAMETFAMGIKALGGKFIGTPSIAGNGGLENIPLPGSIFLRLSMSSVYFPDGTCLLPKGIEPSFKLDYLVLKKNNYIDTIK